MNYGQDLRQAGEDMTQDHGPSTVGALRTVFGVLPTVGSAIVGLSALAYVAGWREASAYYRTLGVPWVPDSFSATRILVESSRLIGVLGFFALLSIVNVAQGAWTPQSLARWSKYLALAAAVCILVGLGLDQWIVPSLVHFLSRIGSTLWAISAGLTVGELVFSIRDAGLVWHDRHLVLTYTMLSAGLWYAPDFEGSARASSDADPTTSALPILISRTQSDSGWRLVTTVDGKFLAVRLTTRKEKRTFRIVEALENWEIRATD